MRNVHRDDVTNHTLSKYSSAPAEDWIGDGIMYQAMLGKRDKHGNASFRQAYETLFKRYGRATCLQMFFDGAHAFSDHHGIKATFLVSHQAE